MRKTLATAVAAVVLSLGLAVPAQAAPVNPATGVTVVPTTQHFTPGWKCWKGKRGDWVFQLCIKFPR